MERAVRLRGRVDGFGPYLPDSLLAVAAAGVALWAVSQDTTVRPWWIHLLAVATALPLPWRRLRPLTVLALATAPSLVISVVAHSANPQVPLSGVVALYTVAERSSERVRWSVLAVVVVGNVLGTHSPNGALFSLVTSVGTFVFGSLVRAQRQLARVQAERAREAGERAASDAARAVAEERARIAREMHDILAHAVSLMVIQAEAGPVVVRSDPDRAVRAFDTIADAGRDAMVQLRRVLGVLKDPEAGGSWRAAPAGRTRRGGRPGARGGAAGGSRTSGAGGSAAGRRGDGGVPDRAGGADQHGQARRGGPGRGPGAAGRGGAGGGGLGQRTRVPPRPAVRWSAGPAAAVWSASGSGRRPAAGGPRPGRGRRAGVSW